MAENKKNNNNKTIAKYLIKAFNEIKEMHSDERRAYTKLFDEETLLLYIKIDNSSYHWIDISQITDKVAMQYVIESEGHALGSLIDRKLTEPDKAAYTISDELIKAGVSRYPQSITSVRGATTEQLLIAIKAVKDIYKQKEVEHNVLSHIFNYLSRCIDKQLDFKIVDYVIRNYYEDEDIIVNLFMYTSSEILKNLPDDLKLLLEIKEEV